MTGPTMQPVLDLAPYRCTHPREAVFLDHPGFQIKCGQCKQTWRLSAWEILRGWK